MKIAFIFLQALFFSAAASAGYPELSVIARSPAGRVNTDSPVNSITITFNQPMVALTAAAKAGEDCPLELFEVTGGLGAEYPGLENVSPSDLKQLSPVPGRCRWQGTQGVSFEPAAPLRQSSLYKAVVKKGARSQVSGLELAQDAEWLIETARQAILQTSPRDRQRWIKPDSTLFAAFTQPADPDAAERFISLEGTGPGGEKSEPSLSVRRAKADEVKKLWRYYRNISTATVLAITPSGMKPDGSYSLVFKAGLPAAGSLIGLEAERRVGFRTYRTFRLEKTPVTDCLPFSPQLSFTNPVRLSELLKNLRSEPPLKFSTSSYGRYSYDYDGADEYGDSDLAELFIPDEDLKPDTSYRFTLSGRLADIFGNRLGREEVFELKTGDLCSYLSSPSGFGILEGYLPARHPVDAVNAGELSVYKAAVPKESFIPFYKSGMKLDLPGGTVRPWAPTAGLRNTRLRTFFDYSALITQEQGGFLFARVPDIYRGHNGTLDILDNVTRLGLTFKTSPDSSFIWTTFLRTGRPAAGVPVEIRSDENKVLWSGATDRNGFADAPGWVKLGIADWPRWQRPALWLFASHKNGDAVMNSGWANGVEPWRFSINTDPNPRPRRYAAALFAERGVYRPGETVNLKGVARRLSGGDWAELDLPAVQLSVFDSRGNKVLTATAAVSAQFSSFDKSFVLPEGSATGVWRVSADEPEADDASVARAVKEDEEDEYNDYQGKEKPFHFSETFRVEEFKPAAFEVKAVPLAGSYLLGGSFSAAIEGWYLFGAPMSGAKADWSLRLEPSYYSPPGYDGFLFGSERGSAGFYGTAAGSGAIELDSKGKGKAEVRLPEKLAGEGALRAMFEAGVTDAERQRLFARGAAWVHRSELYLGVKASGGFVEAGKPWSAEVAAARPDGSPYKGAAVEAKLVKRQWFSSRRAGLGGRLEWVSESTDTVVSSAAFVSGEKPGVFSASPAEGGFYILRVNGADSKGRRAETSFSFYVLGRGEAWWAQEDSDIVEVVAEKEEYRPGETARLMVKSPWDEATALVTVEREGVIKRWTSTTKGGADFIEVPVTDKCVPNVYVSVILLHGRAAAQKYSEDGASDLSKPQAKFGYAAFRVDPGGRRLKVAVSADRQKYRPGERVELTVKTMDEAGRPVSAEAALAAVDEGVLALTSYPTPDIFGAFYGPRPLNVMTADSRLHIIGQRNYGEKGESRGGGGGAAALAGADLRSNFKPTAYWNPAVVTGPDGSAKVSFTLPDNLTRFRLMAAASAGRAFGSGDSSLTVSKPLMLRPNLPRFSRVGDSFDCGAVVHNYSEGTSSGTVSVELSGDAVVLEGEKTREISVPSGKAAETFWACRALKEGSVSFRFRAKAGAETDGLEWKLPVKDAEPREYAATSGVASGLTEKLLRPYPRAPGELMIELSPSALSGLSGGARYLLEYPYGCLEQKLSRAMPVVTGAALIEEFRLGSLDDLKEETRKVFERLGSFQHSSGGFCYWSDGCTEPDPYLTAYALEASALAAREGYASDPGVIGRAADWLSSYLSGEKSNRAYPYSRSEDYAARAYAAYALALNGRNMSAQISGLYASRSQLPYLAKAYLLRAMHAASFDGKASKTLASELLAQARYSPTLMHFEDEEEMPWVHDSPVTVTAAVLDALLEAGGGFPGDEKAVKWLVGERKALGRWRTTVENAWTFRAFQSFYRLYEKEVPDMTALVSEVDGSLGELMNSRFEGRTLAAESRSFGFDRVFGAGDAAGLLVSRSGAGRLYYTLRMGFTPQKRDVPASEGLEISREIKPLTGEGPLKAGARALVTITVKTPQDRTFVAVNDPLPAGFEVVNTAFSVESAEDARALAKSGARGGWWGEFERGEAYDDRMLIFADFLTRGEHKYSYVVQATTPGHYYQPSALAEGMYEPEVFGRTAGASVEVSR